MRRILMYFMILTIPLLLAAAAWQSNRYAKLEQEVSRLDEDQGLCVQDNTRLIADMASLASAERISKIAETDLGLTRKRPEDVLQVKIVSATDAGL
jgi:cell division protein FtsL